MHKTELYILLILTNSLRTDILIQHKKIRCPVGQRILLFLFAEVLGNFYDVLGAQAELL